MSSRAVIQRLASTAGHQVAVWPQRDGEHLLPQVRARKLRRAGDGAVAAIPFGEVHFAAVPLKSLNRVNRHMGKSGFFQKIQEMS